MKHAHVDELAETFGYRYIGGMATNRVYLHPQRQEILKVAVGTEPVALAYARAQFRRCAEISAVYADKALMPEVLAIGDDFHATGYPWLRERYIAGNNLGTEYLADPDFWTAHAPEEIVRITKIMAETHAEDVTATWHEKLDGMTYPSGYEDIYEGVQRSGKYLAERYPTGHMIHGDLQFGNILARRNGNAGLLYLIDWEVSEVMPLGYEFAMLYTFLLGPEAQVEERHRRRYAEIKPLRDFWAVLAPMMLTDLGISEDELKHSVIFRMGNGWLYQLGEATRKGNVERTKELEDDLRNLVSGQYFDVLPYP